MSGYYPVKDYMRTSLITVKPGMNIFEAIDILIKNKISGAPVVDNSGNLVGILSEKDCLELMAENFQHSGYGEFVEDFFTKKVITIKPDTSIFSVADMFSNNHFRRLPVIDNGKLVGQISRRDVLVAIQKLVKTGSKKDSKAIKNKITANKEAKVSVEKGNVGELKKAINNILSWGASIRPLDKRKKPGSLITFGETEQREFLIIGDLHANYENLDAVMNDNKAKLDSNRAVLVFLGDLVHNDISGQIQEMDSSIIILNKFINYINQYPKNIIYLMGNHDTFSSKLTKRRVLQGKIFHEAVIKTHGRDYAKHVQMLFDSLPLFVKHHSFLAMHAGPIRGGLDLNGIINIRHNPNYLKQITWNRINELRATPSEKEYGAKDLEDLRNKLGCKDDIPIFVGHNPLWQLNKSDSVWQNVIDCKNHVIIVSNLENTCPYISVNNSFSYKIMHANIKSKSQSVNDYFNSARY